MELTFCIAAPTMLCFGFAAKTVLIAHQQFWLLLNSACTASWLSLLPTLPPRTSLKSQLEVGKRLGRDTARTVDLNWPKRYSILSNVMLTNKNWGRGRRLGFFSPKWLLFGDWLGISLPVGGAERFPLLRLFFTFLHLLNCFCLDPLIF